MTILARGGTTAQFLLNVPAGQYLTVGNPGGGLAKVSSAAAPVSQLPPIYSLLAVVQPNSGYVNLFAAATSVLIEAPIGNDIEYNIGVAPALAVYPLTNTQALTAKAGGGQGGATYLSGAMNRLTVVATGADSAILPSAIVGARVVVYNQGAASAAIFPQTGESINSGAANASFAVANTKSCIFTCDATGTWIATLSA